MNNEIKEIKIKTVGQLLDYVETEQKAKELIDYITNLQEELNYYITHCEEQRQELHRLNNLPKENKRLQKRNIELVLERDRARGENKVLIDKVIEYIKENKGIDDYNKWVIEDDDNYLLNILEGDDKSE